MLSIPKLGIVNDLHGRIVFDQSKVAGNRCSRGADLLADVVDSSLMGFFGNVNDALVCFVRLGIYLTDGALAVSDFPFAVGIVQLEVNDAQMIAVFPSHGHWSTIDFTVDPIYTRIFFVEASSISAWEFCV